MMAVSAEDDGFAPALSERADVFGIAELRAALFDQLREAGLDPAWRGGQISHCCPAHDDREPSASSTVELGEAGAAKLLMHCFAGCDYGDMSRACGITTETVCDGCRQNGTRVVLLKPGREQSVMPLITEALLQQYRRQLSGSKGEQVLRERRGLSVFAIVTAELGFDGQSVTIPFRDPDRTLLTIERYRADAEPKTLAAHGRPRALWLPPGGLRGQSDVIVAEGALDGLAAFDHGLAAVAAPSAGTWKPAYADALAACGVKSTLVVFDCDDPGRKGRKRVVASLREKGVDVQVVDLDPKRDDGYDLTDWLNERRDSSAADILAELKRLGVPLDLEQKAPSQATNSKFELAELWAQDALPTRWLWSGWIVDELINLLAGEEKAGKGTFACWLIAHLTRGELDGDLLGTPARAIIIGDEDDTRRTWIPRLEAAGADLAMVRHLRGKDGATLTFPSGLDQLRELLLEFPAQLIFCDQLLDNVDGGFNPNNGADVRRALMPLRSLARELGFAVLGTLHTNKLRAGSFRQSIGHSQQFQAVSKSILMVAPHPDGPEERRVLAWATGNYGARQPSREFTIRERSVKPGDHVIRTSLATDFEDCTLTADELCAPPRKAESTSKTSNLKHDLLEILGDHEWHDAGPIIDELTERHDVGSRAVGKVREAIVAETKPKPGYQAGSQWRLPPSRPSDQFVRHGHLGRLGRDGEDVQHKVGSDS